MKREYALRVNLVILNHSNRRIFNHFWLEFRCYSLNCTSISVVLLFGLIFCLQKNNQNNMEIRDKKFILWISEKLTGRLLSWYFQYTLFTIASSATPQIPLSRKMLDWTQDSCDFVHWLVRCSNHTAIDLIHRKHKDYSGEDWLLTIKRTTNFLLLARAAGSRKSGGGGS